MCKINMGNVGCAACIAPKKNHVHYGRMKASAPTDGYFMYYECRGELCSPANNNVYRQSRVRCPHRPLHCLYIFYTYFPCAVIDFSNLQ